MRSLAISDPAVVDVKRLDHLPLVGAMLRELAVKETLDALIPPHERNAVTVGECNPAQKLHTLGDHAGDSTSVRPSFAALLRRLARSRSRARCS
jgi:hypothetical protein